ncbi:MULTISPECIES: hypothetical protein [unclassified Dysgonomonas]|uniref:hypothetical protein n=1 Tax=unclassified Dysgonomonas TaxID=2630389 RepID=UPI00067FBD5F|nr:MULTISPECIES: hypothetical protein [unclassified Dysgonomonas]MBD8349453.1 hypothetical protein [Dysgonomonas sp. HGC4]MBF0577945.1 hypothetical protein [Dysgonomonas sp. GY617]
MKRLFILAVALFSLSSISFAADGNYAFLSKLNEKEKFNGLVNYLGADYEQQRYLKEIFELSSQKMEKASRSGADSDKEVKRALAFNLANTKSVLSAEQYKKYLIVLNMTSINSNNTALVAEK